MMTPPPREHGAYKMTPELEAKIEAIRPIDQREQARIATDLGELWEHDHRDGVSVTYFPECGECMACDNGQSHTFDSTSLEHGFRWWREHSQAGAK